MITLRRTARRLVLALIASVSLVSIVLAHGGNPHLMGTVTAIDVRQIEIKTADGKIVSAHLTKDTKYSKGDTPVTHADVKIGMRAVLHFEGKGVHQTVHEVKLAPDK